MKNTIGFPSSYKKALLNKTKTCTIRTKPEVNKYKEGQIYNAFSYGGADWRVKIRINKIYKKVGIDELLKHGIPKRSIESLVKKENLSPGDKVELIWFSYVDQENKSCSV